MKRSTILPAIPVIALLIQGCMTATVVSGLTDEQIAAMTNDQLAAAYHDHKNGDVHRDFDATDPGQYKTRWTSATITQVENALIARGLTEREMDAARKSTWFVGMSRTALIASLGDYHRINRTVTQYGADEQWVIGAYGTYIYVSDGVVTAFQN